MAHSFYYLEKASPQARRGHKAHGGGTSPQLPHVRVAKRSGNLRGGELMKRLLSLFPHRGLRLQTLYLALLPKLVDRSADQHKLIMALKVT